MAASSAKMLQIAGKTERTADSKQYKRKTIIPKTIRTHYIIWYYIIYTYIYIYIYTCTTSNICQYIHTLHYITLHTSVRTYVHTYIHRYVTLRYITLHTYIFTFDIHTRMYILRMIYIYIDTQCIHIYSVHNWNQLGAAPAGCAWWLWHCSVDSGPCKRLNSQCHGSILISEEKYISSIKLWTAEILSEFLQRHSRNFSTRWDQSLQQEVHTV